MTTVEEQLLKQLISTLAELQSTLRLLNNKLKVENNPTSTITTSPSNNTAESIPLEQKITAIMKEIGIPSNIKGYYYLKDVIIYCMDFDILPSITQKVYPVIAKKYATTPSRTERCIRNAIETAWSRGNYDYLQKLFGYTISAEKGKSTNSEFIACIVNELKRS